jgi:hypothetical protein
MDTHKAALRVQSVVRAFIATKHAKQRVKRFIFRTKVVLEIQSTEANYLRDLRMVMDEYYEPLKNMQLLTKEEHKGIFLNLEKIVDIHTELLAAIEKARENWSYSTCFASAFIPMLEKLKLYQAYIDNFANSTNLLKEKVAASKDLADFLKEQMAHNGRRLALEDFLIMPVQRLPRYVLLLKELAKYTEPGHPDEQHIKDAMEKIQAILSFLNDSKKKVDHLEKIAAIIQKVVDLDQSLVIERQFLYDGPLATVHLIFGAKEEESKAQNTVASNPLDVLWGLLGREEIYVYLFEDMMLCAKKIKRTGDARNAFLNKVLGYRYNVMKLVPIFGNKCATPVKDQECAFRVDTDPNHIYICANQQQRDLWVSKINTRAPKKE